MENFKGQKVVIFYDDGQSISRKEGILTDIVESMTFLETISGQIAISNNRIIRMELINND